jgi:hypothetical protein
MPDFIAVAGRVLPLTAFAATLFLGGPPAEAAPPRPPPGVHNVSRAMDPFYSQMQDGQLVAFQVSEAAQGNVSLNGDGDTIDQVLEVYDGATGATTNLGLASGSTANAHRVAGRLVAMPVSEARQGNTDLNGDGDTADEVLEVYNAATGTTTNLGLAIASGGFGLSAGLVAFCASESDQGVDLNGDGDTSDGVPFIWHPGDAAPTSLGGPGSLGGVGFRATIPLAAGSLASFEAFEGPGDLNGDGDTNDTVLQVFEDGSTPVLENTGLDSAFTKLTPRLAVTDVSEADQGGTDLNGDGDTADLVLHVFEPGEGATNTHTAAASTFATSGNLVAWPVNESKQGHSDLDGDGDIDDQSSMFTFDAASNSTTNLHVGVFDSTLPKISGNVIAFPAAEAVKGPTDLNGDGDKTDFVLQLRNAATATTTNVGLASGGVFDLNGTRLAFAVSESQQGNTDLNGDGDKTDSVLHVRDLAAGTTTNLGLQVGFGPDLDGSLVAFTRPEQAGSDLNGDGDTSDQVPFIRDLAHGLNINVGLAAFGNHPVLLDGGLLTFSVNEGSQGGGSRNGDGDTLDSVLTTYDVSDPDDDGLGRSDEVALGTGTGNPDSDGDGLIDGAEVWRYETGPTDSDSDDDGLSDGAEINTHHTDPLDSDTDGDGLSDGAEVNTRHTDPLDTDTDDDGLQDGAEVNTHHTDPLDTDTDDDGLQDGAEVNTHHTNPLDPDTDHDFLNDGDELALGTSFFDQDSDDDGISDGAEVHAYHSDPLDPDTDGDSIVDGFDNCVTTSNSDQADADHDGLGDACDSETAQPSPPGTPTVTPPETTDLTGPHKVKAGKHAVFTFQADEPDSSFECALDKGGFLPCTSPRHISTRRLSLGKHHLQVRAIDTRGVLDPSPAQWSFRVVAKH